MRSSHFMILLLWEAKTRRTCSQGSSLLCQEVCGVFPLSDVSIPNQNHIQPQNGFVGNYTTFLIFLKLLVFINFELIVFN